MTLSDLDLSEPWPIDEVCERLSITRFQLCNMLREAGKADKTPGERGYVHMNPLTQISTKPRPGKLRSPKTKDAASDEEKLLSRQAVRIPEAAKETGISTDQIRDWIKLGLVETCRIKGRFLGVYLDSLQRQIQADEIEQETAMM